jgi:hypothetical protein
VRQWIKWDPVSFTTAGLRESRTHGQRATTLSPHGKLAPTEIQEAPPIRSHGVAADAGPHRCASRARQRSRGAPGQGHTARSYAVREARRGAELAARRLHAPMAHRSSTWVSIPAAVSETRTARAPPGIQRHNKHLEQLDAPLTKRARCVALRVPHPEQTILGDESRAAWISVEIAWTARIVSPRSNRTPFRATVPPPLAVGVDLVPCCGLDVPSAVAARTGIAASCSA